MVEARANFIKVKTDISVPQNLTCDVNHFEKPLINCVEVRYILKKVNLKIIRILVPGDIAFT